MSIVCTQCQSPNRDIAKYCKACGYEVVILNKQVKEQDFDELIGLSELKKEIAEKITFAKGMRQSGRQFDKKQLHTILIGNTGTAKSKIADLLAKMYFKNGIISKPDSKTVNAVDFINFAKDLAVNLNAAKGGIIFIDEVHSLVPDGYVPGQITPMDKLYVEMEKQNGDPIIILSSRPEGFKEYLKENPKAKKIFNLIFDLPDLTAEEMSELSLKNFSEQKFILEPNAEIKLKKLFKTIVKKKNKEFRNGSDAIKISQEILQNHFHNREKYSTDNVIYEADIQGEIEEDKPLEEILKELNGFIGMEKVKTFIHSLLDNIQQEREKKKLGLKAGGQINLHLVITGNPGTGKTMVTRTLGEILSAIGVLPRGHTVEVISKDLVAGYVGQTKIQTDNKIQEAFGGILFIDEAHQLAEGSDFGKEAIQALLPRLENDRDKFVCVIAGYPAEIEKFLDSDPGLRRRFTNRIHIEDYNPEELLKIFTKKCSDDDYVLTEEAQEKALEIIKEKHRKKDKYFGNAGEMRNLFEIVKLNIPKRLKNIENKSREDYLKILPEDFPEIGSPEKVESFDSAMTALNEMIGLSSVKSEITSLVNLINVQKRRELKGGNLPVLSEHFVFKGNSGTGKTTVARILVNIFKTMGLLPKGQLIEVSSEGLIEGYVRQTGEKTNKVIDSAIGGLLFIDEAYGLVNGGSNDFGKEAITALLQRLENDRGKFITIVAGYNKDMDRFLQSNPGLPSRFTKTIYFEDYTPDEMVLIFKKMVADMSMKLDGNLDNFLLNYFTQMYDNRDEYFANGRTVRNLLEKKVMKNQATRITELEISGTNVNEIISLITEDDFK